LEQLETSRFAFSEILYKSHKAGVKGVDDFPQFEMSFVTFSMVSKSFDDKSPH
jgi:hypothetical protein